MACDTVELERHEGFNSHPVCGVDCSSAFVTCIDLFLFERNCILFR